MEREISCHCGESIETHFPEEIDISTQPETIDHILNGNFMSVTCGACGAVLKPEFTTHLYDSSGRLDITFIPELERTRYLSGKLEIESERVAIGFPELREKMLVFSHKLDDRAVEILKFLLLEKIEDPNSATIILMEIAEGNQLIFHINGIKEEEVALSKVPFHLYERIASNIEERIQEEPFAEITNGQYVSINKIIIEDEES